MERILRVAFAISLLAPVAHAGGVERSSFSSALLFEEGTYTELSFGYVSPTVSGTADIVAAGEPSGNIYNSFIQWSLGFKTDLTEKLSVAVIIDQPIGADTAYPTDTSYPLAGTTAVLNNLGFTALAKYQLPRNISVYGGVRALQTSGDVSLVFPAPYTLETSTELDFGYVVGAAWEKPDIAARVALTYLSAITHTFDTVESGIESTPFSTTIPQTIKLEAQTGVAADTLLFGSVQWTDWSVFDISPNNLPFPGPLVDYASDTYTYQLGVGRRFNEQFSGALIGTYEPKTGDLSGNLGPTDGRTSVGIAATYSPNERMEITGGLTYALLGSTSSQVGTFEGNSAVAAGVRIGVKY